MVLAVRAGEQVEHGNLAGVERCLVTGSVAVAHIAQFELRVPLIQRIEERLELLGALGAEDLHLAVAQAAYHVEVDHRRYPIQREGRMADEVLRAEQAHLLGGEGDEGQAARRRARVGEVAGEAEEHGGARRVVVCTVVGRLHLGGQRAGSAEPEMIIVGADDDDLL